MTQATRTEAPTVERAKTPLGEVEYLLSRKKVRNLNLRVRRNGTVVLSAPRRMPKQEIEHFVIAKAAWIHNAQEAVRQLLPEVACSFSKEECFALFRPVVDAIYPQFAAVLGGQPPTLKVSGMKSRWGVCYPQRRSITLSMRLAAKPKTALEYVVMHEFVHFLHPNHGAGFHAEMAQRMPDYKDRRKLLK